MLADRYRPQTWSEVAGNDRAIERIADLTVNAFETGDPLVLLLTGPAGVGKSTVARLVAKTLGADPTCDVEHIPSGKCSAETVREMEEWFCHTTLFGSGWKAVIVEEVDKIAAQAQSLWLTLLETMPKRRAVVFTSNTRPDELFGGVEGAFVSRCYPVWFTTQGFATTGGKLNKGGRPGCAAERLRTIAQREGINGKPDSYYVALVERAKGNIRAAIHLMELDRGGTEEPAPAQSE